MLYRKLNRLLPIALLMLAAGLSLRIFMHARHSEFVSGFLIGMSLVFMIAGLASQSRGTT